MDDSKPAPPRNPSRTLVIALVAVLIVVAIAGIVLAVLRGRTTSTGPSLSSPTQQGGDAPTAPTAPTAAVSPPVASEVGAGANQVAFDHASDTLTPISLKKIADLALVATKGSHTVEIAAKLEAGPDREKRMETAKKRADIVRKALQAAGVSVNFIKVQISEYPPGLVTPLDADRIELAMK